MPRKVAECTRRYSEKPYLDGSPAKQLVRHFILEAAIDMASKLIHSNTHENVANWKGGPFDRSISIYCLCIDNPSACAEPWRKTEASNKYSSEDSFGATVQIVECCSCMEFCLWTRASTTATATDLELINSSAQEIVGLNYLACSSDGGGALADFANIATVVPLQQRGALEPDLDRQGDAL